MALKFKDKSGRLVQPGDYIIYSQAWGRSAGMNYARVLDIKRVNGRGRKITALRIIGTESWGGNLQNPSTILYSERILVVYAGQVHPKALKALQKYKEEVHGR